MSLSVLARLALLALAFLVMAPVQALLVRAAPMRAGWLPMAFHRMILRLFGIAVRSCGRPCRGGTLVLANHVSWLDIAVIGAEVPLCFVSKSEVAGWPVIRTLARLQRTVFVDRRRKSATAEVAAAVARRLDQGESVVLFAEGTTGDGLGVLPFRSALVGAAGIAGRGPAVGVQPLAIAYTRRNGMALTRRDRPAIAWYGDMELAPHLAALLGGGPIDVVLSWCEPLPAAVAADRKAAAAAAEGAVRRAVRDIRRGTNPGLPILSTGQSA